MSGFRLAPASSQRSISRWALVLLLTAGVPASATQAAAPPDLAAVDWTSPVSQITDTGTAELSWKDPVGSHQGIDGQQAQGRRAVDHNIVCLQRR